VTMRRGVCDNYPPFASIDRESRRRANFGSPFHHPKALIAGIAAEAPRALPWAGLSVPFQGGKQWRRPAAPRALPWAGLSMPFRTMSQDRADSAAKGQGLRRAAFVYVPGWSMPADKWIDGPKSFRRGGRAQSCMAVDRSRFRRTNGRLPGF
jgi:hypothetical protein